jgi:hypothetical protein
VPVTGFQSRVAEDVAEGDGEVVEGGDVVAGDTIKVTGVVAAGQVPTLVVMVAR